MGGFGSRGGLFLMAPLKRKNSSDILVRRELSKSRRTPSGLQATADSQVLLLSDDEHFEAVPGNDSNSGLARDSHSDHSGAILER